jgi:hypothetical protein
VRLRFTNLTNGFALLREISYFADSMRNLTWAQE